MRLRSILPVAVLLLLPALVRGGEGEVWKAPVPAGAAEASVPRMPMDPGVARLVPPGTSVLVYAPSLDRLVEKIGSLARFASPGMALESTGLVAMLLQVMPLPGITPDMVDTGKPLALAGVFPEGGQEPSPMLILPMKDAAAAAAAVVKASRGQFKPVVSGSFLGLGPPGLISGPAEKPPAVTAGLVAGDVTLRVDLADLMARFGPMLQGFFDMGFDEGLKESSAAGGPDLAKFGAAVKRGFGNFLSSAERLDLGLSVGGDQVSVRALFRAKEGSALGSAASPSPGLSALAARLPGDFPFTLALTFDTAKMMEWMQPLLDAALETVPEADREAFRKYMDRSLELVKLLGNDFVLGMSFRPEGMRMAELLSAADAKAYVEKTLALLEEMGGAMKEAGMEFESVGWREVAGRKVATFRIKIDPEKLAKGPGGIPEAAPEEAREAAKAMMDRMFGPDGLTAHLAPVGNKVVAVLGDERFLLQAIAAASGEGSSNSLVREMAAAGGRQKFLLRLELRSFLGGLFDMMRDVLPEEQRGELPDLGEGPPLPVVVSYTSEGRSYAVRLTANAGGLIRLFSSLEGR